MARLIACLASSPVLGVIAIMLRPQLMLEAKLGKSGGFFREEVGLDIPAYISPQGQRSYLATPAPSTPLETNGPRAIYLRALLYNSGWFQAQKCRVYVNRILLNGRDTGRVRSKLKWKGGENNEGPFTPHDVARGKRRGVYVDLCATDEVCAEFQVKDSLEAEGYKSFAGDGLYTLELSAEGSQSLCGMAFLSVDVRFRARDLEKFEIVAARRLPWWKQIWVLP